MSPVILKILVLKTSKEFILRNKYGTLILQLYSRTGTAMDEKSLKSTLIGTFSILKKLLNKLWQASNTLLCDTFSVCLKVPLK